MAAYKIELEFQEPKPSDNLDECNSHEDLVEEKYNPKLLDDKLEQVGDFSIDHRESSPSIENLYLTDDRLHEKLLERNHML